MKLDGLELNAIANMQVLLELAESRGQEIDPKLRADIQKLIDLSVIYFRAWQKDNSIKWHEVKANPKKYKVV